MKHLSQLRWSAVIRFGLLATTMLALPLPAQTPPAPSFTLAEAWKQVQVKNPALAAAEMEVERQAEQRRGAANLSGPQVEITGRYTAIDDDIVIDLDPIRSAMLALHPDVPESSVPSFTQVVQEDRFLKGQLTAVWPVYTGGRVGAAKHAADAAVDEAEAQARRTGDTLLGELVRRFYGAQLARVALVTRTSVLEGLDEHVRQATRLQDEGFISHAEVLHARVAREEAWREWRRAQRQVEIAEVALGGLLSVDGPVVPESPLFLVTRPLRNVEDFIAASGENHPVLSVLEAKQAQASAGVKAERGRFLPEVFLFGSHELNRSDLTLLDPEWAAGVGVRMVLWDRDDRRHSLAAARKLERRLEFLTEDARRGLRTLVEKSYREAAQAQEQFVSLDGSLALAQENLRVRLAAFKEGQATSLDVVDARLALARAETERAAAANEFAVALAALLESSGQPEQFFAYEAQATERISP